MTRQATHSVGDDCPGGDVDDADVLSERVEETEKNRQERVKRAEIRFWAKVEPDPISDCWLWKASTTWDGYGQFKSGGTRETSKQVKAHRWAYEKTFGLVPDGFQLDHLCRVRNCVNPSHLEVVTSKENTMRGESFSALNALKTHCPKGHGLYGENLYPRKDGRRECRRCKKERDSARYSP